MSLTPGARLGPYEVLALIGEGGMGEVYRATDTNLKRQVALKVLPTSLAADSDRLARFQREAEVLAALNHPHIAQIYGLEKSPNLTALVMELVEGEDLSQRIARGAIPLDETLAIAKQIAEALEAAHEQGIIHRDLKPANIKVRSDGTVKVLDFGLAKAMEVVGSPSRAGGPGRENLTQSPTITSPALMTGAGMILGTAAYMAPEQARGRAVDRRADIWAFGCVLYEMLTGHRAFPGDDVTDTLAAVVRAEPDWTLLPAGVSPVVRTFLQRCLHKDPKQRIGDIHDVRLAIEGAFETTPAAVAAPQSHGWRRSAAVAASVLAAAIVSGAVVWLAMRQPAPAAVALPTQRYTLALPENVERMHSMALSPDGRVLVMSAQVAGKLQLWLRPLDALQFQAVRGTDGATFPFWSPDSRYIGFFADEKLKKIAVSGGPAQALCDVVDPRGGSWSRDNVIIFSPSGSPGTAIQLVSAEGGAPADVTARVEGLLARWPSFLSDGRRFVFTTSGVNGGLLLSSLDSRETTRVMADQASVALAPGHLLFVRDSTLMAQPFDMSRGAAVGDAVPVAEEVPNTTNVRYSPVTASDTGILLYQRGSEARFAFVDRTGARIDTGVEPAIGSDLALSPDESSVVFIRNRVAGAPRAVWVRDLARAVDRPLNANRARGGDYEPQWSPRGDRLVFSSNRNNGVFNLYVRPATEAGEDELLLANANPKHVSQWSADGASIVFNELDAKTQRDIWVLPVGDADRTPTSFLKSAADEFGGQLSPDGQWMAYTSDESGQPDVYVRRFPGGQGPWRISSAGGTEVRWRADGRELYFRNGNEMMAVPLRAAAGPPPVFEAESPEVLYRLAIGATGNQTRYSVSADGKRFLVNLPPPVQSLGQLDVVMNWK